MARQGGKPSFARRDGVPDVRTSLAPAAQQRGFAEPRSGDDRYQPALGPLIKTRFESRTSDQCAMDLVAGVPNRLNPVAAIRAHRFSLSSRASPRRPRMHLKATEM